MRLRLFAFLCLIAPAVLADGLPELGDVSQADLSPLMEKKIGESLIREIRQQEPSYLNDPEVEGYINRLGHRLAAQLDTTGQDFDFFVLKDPTINAFAMPGGYIGVHTALIESAQSESELASVLAHEISHVTQHHMARSVSKQNQSQAAALLAMAIGLLASRHNADLAQGAIVGSQAAGIQHQLSYSRDFEREADRMGIQLLEKAGFDIRAMASFFGRLEKSSRLYENNAPSYLLTHPLTTERIADMANRIQSMPYRQVADSQDFLLVRAKLEAEDGSPRDAVVRFSSQLTERRFTSEIATRYGLAQAQMRARNYGAAEAELAELRRLKATSPLIETLAADLRAKQNDPAGAVKILQAAAARYPQERAIAYALVEDLLASHQPAQALDFVSNDLQSYTTDARMYGLKAKSCALLGKRLQQHRAQAEAYALQGQVPAAIEQLQLAQKAPDGNFYEYSEVDARLRELKARQAEEAKEKRQQR